MPEPTVYILRGPSGSGKTTWATTNKFPWQIGPEPAVRCNADSFFWRGGEYNFDPHQLPEARQACQAKFLDWIQYRTCRIIIDNTNIRQWEWTNYNKIAKMAGYKVEIIEFIPETVQEIIECANRNTHGVPLHIVATQTVNFEPFQGATRIPVVSTLETKS